MCGIAGWNLTETPNDSFYLALAAIMEQRGDDSYGYCDLSNEPTVARGIGAISQKLRMSNSTRGFLHTRAATTGEVTKENAHPFEIGPFIGAHNGVIYNWFEIDTANPVRVAPVDSMHIFFHMAEGKPFYELEGYGAIEFYDKTTGALYVACCNGGALEIALTDKGVIYASTKKAIRSAVCQAGLTLIHWYDIDEGNIYEVRADALYLTDREPFALAVKPRFNAEEWRKLCKSSGKDSTAYQPSMLWERELDKQGSNANRDAIADHLSLDNLPLDDSEDDSYLDVIEDECEGCNRTEWVWPDSDGAMLCERCHEIMQGLFNSAGKEAGNE